MMDYKIIPHDIRRVMTFRHIRLIVLSVIWYTALFISFSSFHFYFNNEGIPSVNLSIFILVFVMAPFFYFKIYRIFTEHSYSGVVEEVEMVYKSIPLETNKFKLRNAEFCEIIIRSENGIKHRYSFPDNNGKNDFYHYYHVGDRVCYLKFMRSPYNFNNDESFSVMCVNCNTLDLQNRETCFKCGLTLFKNNNK